MTQKQNDLLIKIKNLESDKLSEQDKEILESILTGVDTSNYITNDKNLIRRKMNELALLLDYEYDDISWLEKAMCSTIIDAKTSVSKSREIYANGRMASLGSAVLKMIVADTLFDENKSLLEIDMHKNRVGDYQNLFKMCWECGIFLYAYCDKSEHDEILAFAGHAPLPAHDIYIESIVAAIYKDKGLEYTREWVKKFFFINGFEIGKTPIYKNEEPSKRKNNL